MAKHSRQKVVAATGLMATAAGVGVLATTADASGAASGKIFACYSKHSGALSYSKHHKCKRGSKLISWNKTGPHGPMGPQGVQGVQGPPGQKGAQGPPGAVAGYANENLAGGGLTAGQHVVATITPTSAGAFMVDAIATVGINGGNWECWAQGSGSTSKTAEAENLQFGTARTQTTAVTGIIDAKAGGSIVEVCNVSPKSGSTPTLVTASLTAVRLSSATKQTLIHNTFRKSSTSLPGAAPTR